MTTISLSCDMTEQVQTCCSVSSDVRAGVWIWESLGRDKSSAWYVTSPLYPWLHNSPRKLHYYTEHTTSRLIREVRGRLIRSCLGRTQDPAVIGHLYKIVITIYNVAHVYTYIFNKICKKGKKTCFMTSR